MKIDVEPTTWHGCRYYAVQPSRSWDIDVNRDNWNKLETWCWQTFGPCGDPWSDKIERWYFNSGKIFIRNESDLALFMLRWR